MSISLLVLESQHFLFKRDLNENPENENTPSELCSISRDWNKLVIGNLACFCVMEVKNTPTPLRLGLMPSEKL